jgi:hypothetical protein
LWKSYPIARYSYLTSIVLIVFSVILFGVFLSLVRTYKEIDLFSLIVAFIAVITLTIVMYYNVNLFGWTSNRVTIILVVLYVISLGLVGATLFFLLEPFCNDPDKIYDDYGHCRCKNNLIEIDGKCGCLPGTSYKLGSSCVPGCRNTNDCGGSQCVGGYCCPSPNINCGNQCCDASDCSGNLCCVADLRRCTDPSTGITRCCDPQDTCVDGKCLAESVQTELVCNTNNSCHQPGAGDEYLQRFYSDTECRTHCADVIFTNTPYTVSFTPYKHDPISVTLTFVLSGSSETVPVIANSDKTYDVIIKADSIKKIYESYLNSDSLTLRTDKLPAMHVYYVQNTNTGCPTCINTMFYCDETVPVTNGPNEQDQARELTKKDMFVIGYGTEGGVSPRKYWFTTEYSTDSGGQLFFSPFSSYTGSSRANDSWIECCSSYRSDSCGDRNNLYFRFA